MTWWDKTTLVSIDDADIEFFVASGPVNVTAYWASGSGTVYIKERVRGVIQTMVDEAGNAAEYTTDFKTKVELEDGDLFGIGVAADSGTTLHLQVTGNFIKKAKRA
jgi:hypothetical protein